MRIAYALWRAGLVWCRHTGGRVQELGRRYTAWAWSKVAESREARTRGEG